MTTPLRSRVILLAFSAFFLGLSQASFAQCSQTLSAGANIASAVSAAPNNSTICLNSGNYGQVNLFGIHRTGFVTLQSVAGVGAVMSPQPGDSRFIRFQSMTLFDVTVSSCSLSIEFVGNTWQVDHAGLLLDGSSCSSTVQNYLVDGDTFDRVGQATYEGRLNCRDCNTVTIRNSLIKGVSTGLGTAGPADGIQSQGNPRNLTIGPGNIFDGIDQSIADQFGGAHVDCIQLQGSTNTVINGNWFRNSSNILQNTNEATTNLQFTNNIASTLNGIQIGTQMPNVTGTVVRHNTFYNTPNLLINSGQSSAFIQNNLLVGSAAMNTTANGGCLNCTISFNMCQSSGCVDGGTTQIVGAPTFVGGSVPSTWAGWQLAAGSKGKNAGSDGQDVGTNYYGPVLGTAPSAPTNLRIIP